MRFILREILEQDYSVTDFDNAAVLLKCLERNSCDLIVSDITLPNMDGFEFIDALKKNNRLACIPVVALTALGSDETRRRAMTSGFAAYVVKPTPRNQLLSVVAKHLRSPA